ncbi:hypothetical protein Tco_1531084 [Tanacetum coccineum]
MRSLCREESQEARDSKDLEVGGEQREISLLEFGWRIGLYSQGQAMENTTLGRLRNCNTVREDRLLMEFWPRIGNGRKQPIESLKLIFIISTAFIPPRSPTTFLIGLPNTLKGNEGEELSYGGCLVSTRLLGPSDCYNEWRCALSVSLNHICSKKYRGLRHMGDYGASCGMCVWPRVMAEEEEDDEGGDEGDEGVGGDAGRGEAGGSADLYRNMSQGDCNNRQFSEF